MCGIFGISGDDGVAKTLDALSFLEYRGYDSAGLCYDDGKLNVVKTAGRVGKLRGMVGEGVGCRSAIGHTRWATHGEVCKQNAHPFVSNDSNFAIVHNGIIENHVSLRRELVRQGYVFSSQTDSETVVHLLQNYYCGSVLDAVCKTAQRLKGAFAVVIQNLHDGCLYAVKQRSSLCVGNCNGRFALSSDVRCLPFASKVAFCDDGCVVRIEGSKVEFFNFKGEQVSVPFQNNLFTGQECTANGDVMLDEIMQIPQALLRVADGYGRNGGIKDLPVGFLRKVNRIYFLGCGTAYNSGLAACAVARKLLNVDVIPVVASEYACGNYPADARTLAFCISQSGETADTLLAAERVKAQGGITCAVTNTVVSALANTCHVCIDVFAGGEFSVASTKAYNCQLATLVLALADVASSCGLAEGDLSERLRCELTKTAAAVEQVLQNKGKMQQLAAQVKSASAVFFIGRGRDYPIAAEASLKLKEISYVHSEAYPAGELKHGTLALMERGVYTVAICTDCSLLAKVDNAASEVAARGATVVFVSPYKRGGLSFTLPVTHEYFSGVLSVVPLQLLAYYTAKKLGNDVDRPRNLAKSVTVE